MPNIGPMELVIVLVIALLVLGPKRLPAAGRAVGQGIREFQDSISGKGDRDAEPVRGETRRLEAAARALARASRAR